jgi:hypothetical protein
MVAMMDESLMNEVICVISLASVMVGCLESSMAERKVVIVENVCRAVHWVQQMEVLTV